LVRFLHSGDWQLGITRRFLDDDAQARFADARFEAIRRIGALAAERRCAFAVVCGDVFESNQVDRRSVARALEALAGVPVPVYLLPGNHDPLDAGSVYRSPAFRERRPRNVHVLEGARPVAVAPGVELVGAPWSSKRPGEDLVAAACALLSPARDSLRILAAHGAVDALSPDRSDPAAIRLATAEAALADGRIHYLALGDRHSLTAVGASGRIHYAGTPEPTDFDEVAPGHVLAVELDAAGARCQALAVGRWRFERREGIPLDGPRDLDGLEDWLAAFDAKERTVLRLAFTGTLDLRGAARLEALLAAARDVFAAVEVWEPSTHLATVAADADFEDLGLAGFAAAGAARLRRRAAAAGDEARTARDALALLVRLAGGAEAAR